MTVYLVGAGPGDPELITVRGARLLRRAEAVLYDRLARPLLALAPGSAKLVDVGKAPGSAPVPQEEINRLLVDYGRHFGCVVRLKGGDPFVFARGAEEAMALGAAGVDYEVVPGISSALAAPAAAGVPLTVRSAARSFTVVTGHEDPDAVPTRTWQALADLGGTIVVLMGAGRISALARHLVAAGLAPETPVVASFAATTVRAGVRRFTLATVPDEVIPSPTTFVIGDVAGLDLRSGVPGGGGGVE